MRTRLSLGSKPTRIHEPAEFAKELSLRRIPPCYVFPPRRVPCYREARHGKPRTLSCSRSPLHHVGAFRHTFSSMRESVFSALFLDGRVSFGEQCVGRSSLGRMVVQLTERQPDVFINRVPPKCCGHDRGSAQTSVADICLRKTTGSRRHQVTLFRLRLSGLQPNRDFGNELNQYSNFADGIRTRYPTSLRLLEMPRST